MRVRPGMSFPREVSICTIVRLLRRLVHGVLILTKKPWRKLRPEDGQAVAQATAAPTNTIEIAADVFRSQGED